MPTQEATENVTDRERNERGTKNNGRENADLRDSEEETARATDRSQDAIEQLVPAWIHASRAFIPAAVYNPWQALNAMFDAQQQALTLQRKFWGEMLNQSQNAMNRMNDQRHSHDDDGHRGHADAGRSRR
jgi:hypothetical protein